MQKCLSWKWGVGQSLTPTDDLKKISLVKDMFYTSSIVSVFPKNAPKYQIFLVAYRAPLPDFLSWFSVFFLRAHSHAWHTHTHSTKTRICPALSYTSRPIFDFLSWQCWLKFNSRSTWISRSFFSLVFCDSCGVPDCIIPCFCYHLLNFSYHLLLHPCSAVKSFWRTFESVWLFAVMNSFVSSGNILIRL